MFRRIKGYVNGVPYYTKREKELLMSVNSWKKMYEKEVENNKWGISKKLPVMVMGKWKEVCPLCKGEVEERWGEYCCKNCMMRMIEKSVSLSELFGREEK